MWSAGGHSIALAQTGQMRRVGVLVLSAGNASLVVPFKKRLGELGWIEGKNLALEVRNADNRLDRLPALVAELVHLNVDVLVTASTPVTRAAKGGTASTPIVFTWVSDPVGSGLVASLARPGGNLTGLSNVSFDVAPKQIELLQAFIPGLQRLAVLGHPAFDSAVSGPGRGYPLKEAAARAGLVLISVSAQSAGELEGAFAAAARERAAAMVVLPVPLFADQRTRIAELARRFHMPTASQARSFVESGGLVSYGSDLKDGFVRTAAYVDKILRGTKPADLPVEQADRFELAVNRGTAKALGLAIPQSVLLRADEVID